MRFCGIVLDEPRPSCLAAAAGDEAKETPDFRNAVAHRVPRDLRLPEAKLLHERGLNFKAALAQRRQGPGSAAELADQNARAQFLQTFEMALESREVGCGLVAERDRHRLLEIAAACHRGVAIALCQGRKRVRDRNEINLDEIEGFADLQDSGGVGDVLGGGAPMTPLAEAVPAQRNELLDDRQHRITDALGLALELGEVIFGDPAMAQDFVARMLRNDAETRLGAGERRFDVEIFLDAMLPSM